MRKNIEFEGVSKVLTGTVPIRQFEKTHLVFSMWFKVDKIIRLCKGSLNIGTVPAIKPHQYTI